MNTKNYLILTKRYRTFLSNIHTVYRLVNSTFELKSLVYRLTRLIPHVMDASCCQVAILDKNNKYTSFKCLVSPHKKYFCEKKKRIENPMEKKIVEKSAFLKNEYLLAVPLISEDVIGFIILKRNKNGKPFDLFDQETFATLCEQAVMGVRNIQLYEEQQRVIMGSIKSLVTLLDAKVPVAYTHSRYFTRLVILIARQMNVDQGTIDTLTYASALHDAGKVDVPLEILTKTTRLTPREFNIIKGHPVKGAQILKHMQLLKPVIPVILHHHERYDGKGYPSGLKGDKIPLAARIMAVADAFEAMVYGRPYRKRLTIQKAVREIRQNSAKQFDPKVVESFLRVFEKSSFKKLLHLG